MEEQRQSICLLNDSFPPLIDGVANTVVNYASILPEGKYSSLVVVPSNPDADDSGFPYPVVRYPSIDLRKQIGYTAGNPFLPKTVLNLKSHNIALVHSHCPFASNYLARGIREQYDVPLVMTYHTKFDIDIANAVRGKLFQQGAIKALVESVSAVDELWVVSNGAGENIRQLGYEGDYVVMQNGVDMPKRRATEQEVAYATRGYDLPADVPVFLFVGRLMWYKGLKIIIDAMKALKSQDLDFRMVFIGGKGDEAEVKAYVEEQGLSKKCLFTGAIHDRSAIAAWYTRADLFLFPSTYDTNGLVVREAAACSLGTVMVGGSCAAEGVTNGVNGLFIEENAASLAVCLARVMENRDFLRKLGARASDDLYLSWHDAVQKAEERYEIVIDHYKCGIFNKRRDIADEMYIFRSELFEAYEKMEERKKRLEEHLDDNFLLTGR